MLSYDEELNVTARPALPSESEAEADAESEMDNSQPQEPPRKSRKRLALSEGASLKLPVYEKPVRVVTLAFFCLSFV